MVWPGHGFSPADEESTVIDAPPYFLDSLPVFFKNGMRIDMICIVDLTLMLWTRSHSSLEVSCPPLKLAEASRPPLKLIIPWQKKMWFTIPFIILMASTTFSATSTGYSRSQVMILMVGTLKGLPSMLYCPLSASKLSISPLLRLEFGPWNNITWPKFILGY